MEELVLRRKRSTFVTVDAGNLAVEVRRRLTAVDPYVDGGKCECEPAGARVTKNETETRKQTYEWYWTWACGSLQASIRKPNFSRTSIHFHFSRN